ncbi:MAG TPA: VWA domain-containing protein [Solirubrobacteraceae bacterium]
MSFASPTWLLALALVPLALLAYLASRRNAKRYAVRFTAVPALKVAAGAVPAWRRHLPAALALAALAALVLALAKPQATVAVPVERASIMLVTDHSRSMQATDVQPDRLAAAQRAARTFLDELPEQVRVGAVAFSDTPDAVQAPSNDHDGARRIVDGQVADGATATGDALQVAIDALRGDRQNGKRPPSAIVLLSDGKTTVGPDPVQIARAAGRLHIRIYTVALGNRDATVPNPNPFGTPLSVAPDPETLRRISEVSNGRAFTAEDDDQLSSIYKTLGSQLGKRKQQKEVTASFAIGGLVLLLGAAAASVRWAGRLP